MRKSAKYIAVKVAALFLLSLTLISCSSTPNSPEGAKQAAAETNQVSAVSTANKSADDTILVYKGSGKYGNTVLYLIFDTSTKTLQRFTSEGSEIAEYTYSGEFPSKIKTAERSYELVRSNSLDEIVEKPLTGARKSNYYIYLKRTSLTDAEQYKKRIENWYQNYDSRFAEHMIQFGSYEQDGNTDNGTEPLDWVVLANDGDKSLVVCNYYIAQDKFNDVDGGYIGCTWQSSTVRNWLNDVFYNSAFSDTEKQKIQQTIIEQEGNKSSDSVFLLSSQEVETYFPKAKDKWQAGGIQSISKGTANDKQMRSWWLRDSTEKEYQKTCIDDSGKYTTKYTDDICGIRPAMWIDASLTQDVQPLNP